MSRRHPRSMLLDSVMNNSEPVFFPESQHATCFAVLSSSSCSNTGSGTDSVLAGLPHSMFANYNHKSPDYYHSRRQCNRKYSSNGSGDDDYDTLKYSYCRNEQSLQTTFLETIPGTGEEYDEKPLVVAAYNSRQDTNSGFSLQVFEPVVIDTKRDPSSSSRNNQGGIRRRSSSSVYESSDGDSECYAPPKVIPNVERMPYLVHIKQATSLKLSSPFFFNSPTGSSASSDSTHSQYENDNSATKFLSFHALLGSTNSLTFLNMGTEYSATTTNKSSARISRKTQILTKKTVYTPAPVTSSDFVGCDRIVFGLGNGSVNLLNLKNTSVSKTGYIQCLKLGGLGGGSAEGHAIGGIESNSVTHVCTVPMKVGNTCPFIIVAGFGNKLSMYDLRYFEQEKAQSDFDPESEAESEPEESESEFELEPLISFKEYSNTSTLVHGFAIHPNPNLPYLAVADDHSVVHVWSYRTGKLVSTIDITNTTMSSNEDSPTNDNPNQTTSNSGSQKNTCTQLKWGKNGLYGLTKDGLNLWQTKDLSIIN